MVSKNNAPTTRASPSLSTVGAEDLAPKYLSSNWSYEAAAAVAEFAEAVAELAEAVAEFAEAVAEVAAAEAEPAAEVVLPNKVSM